MYTLYVHLVCYFAPCLTLKIELFMNYDEIKNWQVKVRRALEDEREHLSEKERQINDYLRALEVMDGLIVEVDDLSDMLEEEKERSHALEVKLSELNKLTAGVAKKSPQDDMIKAIRTYLNTSKRKTLSKREAAKMVLTELFTSAKLDLPEDILDLLEHLDDEQADPKVVNVTGNYNDIHNNGSVDMNNQQE